MVNISSIPQRKLPNSKRDKMNRPTGLVFGKYKRNFLFWIVTWQTIGWEYDDYITTKDIVVDIKLRKEK